MPRKRSEACQKKCYLLQSATAQMIQIIIKNTSLYFFFGPCLSQLPEEYLPTYHFPLFDYFATSLNKCSIYKFTSVVCAGCDPRGESKKKRAGCTHLSFFAHANPFIIRQL